MKSFAAFLLTVAIAVPAFAKRPVAEFHFLENEPAAGLTPVQVPSFNGSPEWKYMHAEVVMDHSDVATVKSITTKQGDTALEIKLTAAGAAKLARLSSANVGKRLALVMDGRIIVAPRIIGPIPDGVVILQGGNGPGFSLEKIAAALQPLFPR